MNTKRKPKIVDESISDFEEWSSDVTEKVFEHVEIAKEDVKQVVIDLLTQGLLKKLETVRWRLCWPDSTHESAIKMIEEAMNDLAGEDYDIKEYQTPRDEIIRTLKRDCPDRFKK